MHPTEYVAPYPEVVGEILDLALEDARTFDLPAARRAELAGKVEWAAATLADLDGPAMPLDAMLTVASLIRSDEYAAVHADLRIAA